MKKFVAFILCVLTALSVVSFAACSKNEKGKLQKDAGITLDGVVKEDAYKELPTHYTGIKGRLKPEFAADEKGLYVGIKVSDTDMRSTGNGVEGILASDYVGIAIDVSATRDEITPVGEKTVLFRFDASGRYAYSKGNDYGDWDEIASGEGSEKNNESMPKFAFRIDGTVIPVGDTSEVEGNVGYYAELFFTWNQLGTSASEIAKKGKLMYCMEHRDVDWDIVLDATNITDLHKFNTLTLFGERKGANIPEKASEVKVDGKLDDAAWANAPVLSSGVLSEKVSDATAGEYTVKAFMGKNGMVVGIDVKETQLVSEQRSITQAYKDCGAELRIHVFEKDTDMPVISHQWLFDLFGPKWHEVKIGIDGKYAPYAEWQFDIRGTINDNTDVDDGWSLELYIPFETLLVPYMDLGVNPEACYVKLLPAVASGNDKKAIPDGCEWDKVETYKQLETI